MVVFIMSTRESRYPVRFVKNSMLRHLLLLFVLSSLSPTAQRFGPETGGIGGAASGPGGGARAPFRVKFSGILNPTAPKEDGLKVATLSVSGYRETYRFEIMQAEAVDDTQVMRSALVPQVRSYTHDFLVVGTKELLSQIGQALPNTPITITGFLRQRKRELILESIETMIAVSPAPALQPEVSPPASAMPPETSPENPAP